MEDKKVICNLLLQTLQATRQNNDLLELRYESPAPDYEIVTAVYASGSSRKINVSLDSGIAMIRDITKALS